VEYVDSDSDGDGRGRMPSVRVGLLCYVALGFMCWSERMNVGDRGLGCG